MQTFNLDLTKKEIVPLLNVKQKDVGKKISVSITDNGKEYTIPTGASFSVWFSGKSGDGHYDKIGNKSAFSVSGSTVTIELILQMLNNPGIHSMCLVMNNASGEQIGLWNIPYFVEALPGANSEPATKYFENLEAAQEAADRAEAAAKRAEAAGGGGGSVEPLIVMLSEDGTTASHDPYSIKEYAESGVDVYLQIGDNYFALSYTNGVESYFSAVYANGLVDVYKIEAGYLVYNYKHNFALTEEGKAEIVADVIAALPVYNGEVV